MTEPMRALTVRPPWSQAIAHGTKRVENRTRPAPKLAVGGLIAIHAGKSFDWDATFPPGHMAEWAAPEDCVLGAVVAVALLDGCHWPPSPIQAFTRAGHACSSLEPCSAWGMPDEVHWELDEVQALREPVPCRGALGLWRLPEDVEKAVREQLSEVGR